MHVRFDGNKGEEIRIKAERRDMKFEEGIRSSTDRLMFKRKGKEYRKKKELQGKIRIFKGKWLQPTKKRKGKRYGCSCGTNRCKNKSKLIK